MRSVLYFFAAVMSLNVFAGRSGVDERVHTCTVTQNDKYIGKGKFRVHVIAGKQIKVTRLKDKKWILMEDNDSGTYVSLHDGKGGTLWPAEQKAYMYDVKKDGDLSIAYGVSEGSYEMIGLQCTLSRVISELDPLTPTEIAINKIAEEIEFGNGGYDISKFELTKTKIGTERAALLKKRFKGCKWQPAEGLADVNKLIAKRLYEGNKVVSKINELKKQVPLSYALALVSDNDVSCSRGHIWIYTKDGFKFDMNIDGSD